jgi:3-phosphoshikimate 1-carboxyvinyltransferase
MLHESVDLKRNGEPVSRRHSQLSLDLCLLTGAPSTLPDTLEPWAVKIPNGEIRPPRDASMLAFAFLAVAVTGAVVELPELPHPEDSLGHEVLVEYAQSLGIKMEDGVLKRQEATQAVDLDLRDANDLITPVAALLALGSGGTLRGAAHAAHKETNRLKGSQQLLDQFGIKASLTEDGLVIAGGQEVHQPASLVRTYGDHRMQMTALNLAMGCSQTVLVEGSSLHEVADPEAVQRWKVAGVSIESVLHQPW